MKVIFEHSDNILKSLHSQKNTLCKVIESLMNIDADTILITEKELYSMVFAFMHYHLMVSQEHIENESIFRFVEKVYDNEVLDFKSILILFENMIVGQTQDESDEAEKNADEHQKQVNDYYQGNA